MRSVGVGSKQRVIAWLFGVMLILGGCSSSDGAGESPRDDQTKADAPVPIQGVVSVAVDNTSHNAVISHGDGKDITVMDLLSGAATQLDLPFTHGLLAMHEAQSQIFVADPESRIHAVSQTTGSVLINSEPLAHQVHFLAVAEGLGLIAALSEQGQLSVLDTQGLMVSASQSMDGEVKAVAVWPEASVLYVLLRQELNDALVAVNLTTGAVLSTTLLSVPAADLVVVPKDGWLLVGQTDAPGLMYLDLSSLTEVQSHSLAFKPQELLLPSASGSVVVLSNEEGAPVNVVDMHTSETYLLGQSLSTWVPSGVGHRFNELLTATGPDATFTRIPLISPQPQLQQLAPAAVDRTGGSVAINLYGGGFVEGARLEFEGLDSFVVTRWLDQGLLQVVFDPVNLPEKDRIAVRVHNPEPSDGASEWRELRIEGDEPRIDSVFPIQGLGGDLITIFGARFSAVPAQNRVAVGGVEARVIDATEETLLVLVPFDTEGGVIQVQTAQGEAQSTAEFRLSSAGSVQVQLTSNEMQVPFAGQASIYAMLAGGASAVPYPVRLKVAGDLPESMTAELSAKVLTYDRPVELVVRGEAQPGTYSIALVVEVESEDGIDSTTHEITVHVLEPDTTFVQGRVLDALSSQPLAGVRVQLDDRTTFTDTMGQYLLAGIEVFGPQTVKLDGSLIRQDACQYPSSATADVTLEAGIVNQLPIHYMSAVEPTAYTTIEADTPIVVARDDLPGYRLTFSDEASLVDGAGDPIERVYVRAMPADDLTTLSLPENLVTNTVFVHQFHPAGQVTLSGSAAIRLPNDLGLAAGEQAEIWHADNQVGGEQKEWTQLGVGIVSEDGQYIIAEHDLEMPEHCCGLLLAASSKAQATRQKSGLLQCSASEYGVDLFSGMASVLSDHGLRLGGDPAFGIDLQQSLSSSGVGLFGAGVYADFEWLLDFSDQYVTVIHPDGQRNRLVRQGSGAYRQSLGDRAGFAMALQQRPSGWALSFGSNNTLSFDEQGFLLAVENLQGQPLITFDRDGDAPTRVNAVRDLHGREFTLSYELSDDLITAIRGPLGREQTFEYEQRRLVHVLGWGGVETHYQWREVEGKQRIVERDVAGIVTRFDYEDSGERLTKISHYGSGESVEWEYEFVYGPNGTEVTGADQKTYLFNRDGYEVRREDSLGRVWSYDYSAEQRLLSSILDPLQRLESFDYDERGHIVATHLKGQSVAVDYHRHRSQPLEVVDANGYATELRYDDTTGLLRLRRNPEGEAYSYHYNYAGRLQSITKPSGAAITLGYDSYGNINRIVDAAGSIYHYKYDIAGRLKETQDALGNVSAFDYDDLDRLVKVTDPLEREYTLNHTEQGVGYKLQHDQRGNVESRVDPRGAQVQYLYDSAGRVIRSEDSDGRVIEYTYDHADRVTRVRDNKGPDYRYRYDDKDRLIQEVSPLGTIQYRYDDQNRSVTRLLNGTVHAIYRHDRAGRIQEIQGRDKSVQYQYDDDGNLLETHLPNNISKIYRRDAAGRVVSIDYIGPDNEVLDVVNYGYNSNGDIVLRSQREGEPIADTPFQAAYNSENQLVRFNDWELEYDASGNLIRRALDDDQMDFEWDAHSRLTEVRTSNTKTRYSYDYRGRRIGQAVDGVQVQYLYSGNQLMAELDAEAQVVVSYHPDRTHFAAARTGSGATTYYLKDAQGSVIATTNADGEILQRYFYSAYGETARVGEAHGNAIQYGGWMHDSNGLYYQGDRYYDPTLNRYIQKPPVDQKNTVNAYIKYPFSPDNFGELWQWPMPLSGKSVASANAEPIRPNSAQRMLSYVQSLYPTLHDIGGVNINSLINQVQLPAVGGECKEPALSASFMW